MPPSHFIHHTGDTYHVTGVTYNPYGKGKRFKQVHSNPYHAMMINLYCGSVWQVRNGKRKLVKRVYN